MKVPSLFGKLQHKGPHYSIVILGWEEGVKDRNLSNVDTVLESVSLSFSEVYTV